MTPVLHVQNLCASYGARHILDGVHLDVQAGEIVTVIGHNGAGKSTLLRAIFNLVPWRSGTVQLLGQDVTHLASDRLLGAGMAYVPQHRSVFPRLTIEENLQMGGYLVRDRQLLAQRIDKVLELFPILKMRAGQMAGTMSGGEALSVSDHGCVMELGNICLRDAASSLIGNEEVARLYLGRR